MDTRQGGAAPAVAARHHLPRLRPAGAAGVTGAAGVSSGGTRAARMPGRGWAAGLAPPRTALTASCAPSHATSTAS
jgi:hypothetical protein